MQVTSESLRGRDFSLDFLRAAAIAEVVLAHSGLPDWLFQLRNFGVPLLLLIAGMSFAESTQAKGFAFLDHMAKRIRRLVVPTWAFLAIFFAVVYGLVALGLKPTFYPIEKVVRTFALLDGIGYVWVIRVNLMMALMAGVFIWIDRQLSTRAFLATVFGLVALNEVLWVAFSALVASGPIYLIGSSTLFFALPYGAIFLLGMRAARLKRSILLVLGVIFFAMFLGLAAIYGLAEGHFVPTQEFKAPPQAYYLAYALAVSLVIVAFRNELAGLVPASFQAGVAFVGRNTLGIYLWHILALELLDLQVVKPFMPQHYLFIWGVTLAAATAGAWLQMRVVMWLQQWRSRTERIPDPTS